MCMTSLNGVSPTVKHGQKKVDGLNSPINYEDFVLRSTIAMVDLFSVAAEIAIIRLHRQDFPIEDMVTQIFLQSDYTKATPLSTLFTFQAFVDIKTIMGKNVGAGFDDLVRAKNSMNVEFRLS